jgi:hypothetical protein
LALTAPAHTLPERFAELWEHRWRTLLSIDYAYGELSTAIITLAATDKPLRERLAEAVERLGIESEADLPEALRPHFDAFLARITRAGGGPGQIWATIRELSDEELGAHARELVALYEEAAVIYHGTRSAQGS